MLTNMMHARACHRARGTMMSQRGARGPEIRPALYSANKEHLLELVTHSSV